MRAFSRVLIALTVAAAAAVAGLASAAAASADTIATTGSAMPPTGPNPFAALLFIGFALIAGVGLAIDVRRRVKRGA